MKNKAIIIGAGKDIIILEQVEMIREIIGYEGKFTFNEYKLDGTHS